MGTSGKVPSVRRVDRLLPLVPFGLCYVLLSLWTLLTSTTPFDGESVRPFAWAFWSIIAAAPFWWFLRRVRQPTEYGEQVLLVIASLLFGAALVRLIDRSSWSTPIRSYVMILSEVHSTGKYPYVVVKSPESGVTRKVSYRDMECFSPNARVLVVETDGVLGIGLRRYTCQNW